MTDLFAKYDVPAPRYTSYPTVPFWTDSPTTEQWLEHLGKAFEAAPLSDLSPLSAGGEGSGVRLGARSTHPNPSPQAERGNRTCPSTWSLYFHLPYCESLCTFCACNTVITRDHGREEDYVNLLSTEWNLYLIACRHSASAIVKVHLGGGTPTFFSAQNLKRFSSQFSQTHIDVDRFDLSRSSSK